MIWYLGRTSVCKILMLSDTSHPKTNPMIKKRIHVSTAGNSMRAGIMASSGGWHLINVRKYLWNDQIRGNNPNIHQQGMLKYIKAEQDLGTKVNYTLHATVKRIKTLQE